MGRGRRALGGLSVVLRKRDTDRVGQWRDVFRAAAMRGHEIDAIAAHRGVGDGYPYAPLCCQSVHLAVAGDTVRARRGVGRQQRYDVRGRPVFGCSADDPAEVDPRGDSWQSFCETLKRTT